MAKMNFFWKDFCLIVYPRIQHHCLDWHLKQFLKHFTLALLLQPLGFYIIVL